MLELEDARKRILAAVGPLPCEPIALGVSGGRVLGEDIVPAVDLPAFDNSAMDGYAVQSSDVVSASKESPIELQLCGRVAAGEVFQGTVEPGNCVRIFTGSPMPRGADAVVMQEDTTTDGARPGWVQVVERVKPWENVRFRGEDVKSGAPMLRAGQRITTGRLGLLGAVGVMSVEVRRQPIIGLLATGSELVEAGAPLSPGKVYESNRTMLASLLERSGGVPRIRPIVPDTLDATRSALAQAFAECDAVVTCGGVSVGELDFVKQAYAELGGAMEFWKVAIKPGKPFVFGQWNKKLFFGLPGNPVSAVVTFLLLVQPALLALQGATDLGPETGACELAETLQNRADRRHFVRVQVDEFGRGRSAGTQASHLLGSLAAANGLVDVPAHSELAEGSIVPVIRFGN